MLIQLPSTYDMVSSLKLEYNSSLLGLDNFEDFSHFNSTISSGNNTDSNDSSNQNRGLCVDEHSTMSTQGTANNLHYNQSYYMPVNQQTATAPSSFSSPYTSEYCVDGQQQQGHMPQLINFASPCADNRIPSQLHLSQNSFLLSQACTSQASPETDIIDLGFFASSLDINAAAPASSYNPSSAPAEVPGSSGANTSGLQSVFQVAGGDTSPQSKPSPESSMTWNTDADSPLAIFKVPGSSGDSSSTLSFNNPFSTSNNFEASQHQGFQGANGSAQFQRVLNHQSVPLQFSSRLLGLKASGNITNPGAFSNVDDFNGFHKEFNLSLQNVPGPVFKNVFFDGQQQSGATGGLNTTGKNVTIAPGAKSSHPSSRFSLNKRSKSASVVLNNNAETALAATSDKQRQASVSELQMLNYGIEDYRAPDFKKGSKSASTLASSQTGGSQALGKRASVEELIKQDKAIGWDSVTSKSKKKGAYKCAHCSKNFKTFEKFIYHIDEAGIAEHRSNRCVVGDCPYKYVGFPRRAELRRHMLAIHGTNLPVSEGSPGPSLDKSREITTGKAEAHEHQAHTDLHNGEPQTNFNMNGENTYCIQHFGNSLSEPSTQSVDGSASLSQMIESISEQSFSQMSHLNSSASQVNPYQFDFSSAGAVPLEAFAPSLSLPTPPQTPSSSCSIHHPSSASRSAANSKTAIYHCTAVRPYCTKSFPRKDSLQRHIRLCHSNPQSRFNKGLQKRKLKEQINSQKKLKQL